MFAQIPIRWVGGRMVLLPMLEKVQVRTLHVFISDIRRNTYTFIVSALDCEHLLVSPISV